MVLPLIAVGISAAGAYYFAEEEVENLTSEAAVAAIKIAEWTVLTIIDSVKDAFKALSITSKIKRGLFQMLEKISDPSYSSYISAFLMVFISILVIKRRTFG